MTDQNPDENPRQDRPALRDENGQIIGGVTAHAPGIHQGDDLSQIVGANATNAEDVAAELARRESEGQPTPSRIDADPTSPPPAPTPNPR